MSNPNRRRSPWDNGHFCTHTHTLFASSKKMQKDGEKHKETDRSISSSALGTHYPYPLAHCLLSILKFRRSRATKPTFLQIPARLRSNGLLLSIVQNKGVKLQSRFFTYLKNHHLMVFSHHLRLVFSEKISVRQPMRGLFR